MTKTQLDKRTKLLRAALEWYRERDWHGGWMGVRSAGLSCPRCARRFRTMVKAIKEYDEWVRP